MAKAVVGFTAILLLSFHTQDPADKVRALVDKLGSDNLAERETATAELIKLGPSALPAVRNWLSKAEGERGTRLEGVARALERAIKVAQLTAPGPRVTLEAKDRPAGELLAEIAKQSGCRVDGSLLPADTRLSLEAEGLSPAAVIDELCRCHGKIMYQWSTLGVRLRPESYRKVPVFDSGPFRFIADSIEWAFQRSDFGGGSYPTLRGGLVVPLGRMPAEAAIVIESMEDDKGTQIKVGELLHDPDTNLGWDGKEPHVFHPLTWIGGSPPAAGAKRLKSCKGHIRLTYVLGTNPLVTLKNPQAPSPPNASGDGLELEVVKWVRDGDSVDIKFGLNLDPAKTTEDDRMPGRRRFALHDARGRWIFGRTGGMSSFDNRGKFRTLGSISFDLPPGFEVSSFDFLGALDEEAVKVPFDLGEVALQ